MELLWDRERALSVWLISHQPAVLFPQNKSAISNQPTVLFLSEQTSTRHQPPAKRRGCLKCSWLAQQKSDEYSRLIVKP
jgi:hypothetical protein